MKFSSKRINQSETHPVYDAVPISNKIKYRGTLQLYAFTANTRSLKKKGQRRRGEEVLIKKIEEHRDCYFSQSVGSSQIDREKSGHCFNILYTVKCPASDLVGGQRMYDRTIQYPCNTAYIINNLHIHTIVVLFIQRVCDSLNEATERGRMRM